MFRSDAWKMFCALSVALSGSGCLGNPPTGGGSPDAGFDASMKNTGGTTATGGSGGGSSGSSGSGGTQSTGTGGAPSGGTAGTSSMPTGGTGSQNTGGEPATDAGDGGGKGPICTPGGTCDPGECQLGQLECGDAGALVCTTTGPALDGTTCGSDAASGVCNGGKCSVCDTGIDCTPTGSCHRMTTACDTGKSVCTAAGNVRDGTSCGNSQYCNSGNCAACTNDASCAPTNPCHQGKVTCANGLASCTDQNTNAADGTTCGTNEVCKSGACVACTANVVCIPDNPCHKGLTSCATGVSKCVDTNTSQADGSACSGTNECFRTYTCQSGACTGSAAVSCPPADACHVAGTCNPADGTCTPKNAASGTACNDGNACTQTDTCNGQGACVGANPVTCTAKAPQCQTEACDKTSGTCKTSNVANGAACGSGTGMSCTNGACGCTNTSQTVCSGACVNTLNDPNNCGSCGSPCPSPYVCSGGQCGCPSNLTYCAAQFTCSDLTTDGENCGACGHSCIGTSCVQGQCAPLTIGNTPNGEGAGLALGPQQQLYFTDNGSNLYGCADSGCGGTPHAVYSSFQAAGTVKFDSGSGDLYVTDANLGTFIVTTGGGATKVLTDGTPEDVATDGTYMYVADLFGIGKANKTTGALATRVWSASNTLTVGVDLDPATGRVWGAVRGASTGQVASCDPNGGGCTTWAFPDMEKVHIVNGLPYLVTTDGIFVCASTSDCSNPTTIYAGTSIADITWTSTYIYFSNSSAGIAKCKIPNCGQNPTSVTGAGAFAAAITNDGSFIYWITDAGAVQRVAM